MTAVLFESLRDSALELKQIDPREKPCRDLDLDCLATDGVVPFGDYYRCHQYDPAQGKCPFADR